MLMWNSERHRRKRHVLLLLGTPFKQCLKGDVIWSLSSQNNSCLLWVTMQSIQSCILKACRYILWIHTFLTTQRTVMHQEHDSHLFLHCATLAYAYSTFALAHCFLFFLALTDIQHNKSPQFLNIFNWL